jgi:quercetin dioxygenase-like cupin family protein
MEDVEVKVMSGSPAARTTVVHPGEGEATGVAPGIGVVFKVGGPDTGGAVSIVEQPFAVGALVPPHRHTREDEVSIVVDGQVGFRSGDLEVVLDAGGYIVKPRGEIHAMWNAGKAEARIIEIITPAGFEAATGAVDPEALNGMAARYGMSFEAPEWLPDVIARYGLKLPSS